MPFNLLLLPALGGYLALHHTHRTRFFLARQDGYRFVLWVALASVLLLALSTLLVGVVATAGPGAQMVTAWKTFVPFAHAGKAVGALLLGLLAPLVLNQVAVGAAEGRPWSHRPAWAKRALELAGDELELLCLRSLEQRAPVLMTLRGGKVYIGLITRSLPPDVGRRFVRLLPILSGYRTPDTHEVCLTTPYQQVRDLANAPESDLYGLLEADFEIVLPVQEIVTASLFDFEAYTAFQAMAEGGAATEPR